MIHSFYVENFLSIRDRQEISFATTADKTVRDLVAVEVKPNVYINKLGIFYGANASGKSNIIFAMSTLFALLRFPQSDKTASVINYYPFALTNDAPTYFKIVFYKDSVQYEYEISYCKTHIISESLYYYPTRNKALFYTRRFVSTDTQPKIEFGNTLGLFSKTKQTLCEQTFNNHTVLSTFAKVSLKENAKEIASLYNWILYHYHNDDSDTKPQRMIAEMNEVCADPTKKQFYLSLLKKADFNIVNFSMVDNFRDITEEQLDIIKKLPIENQMSLLKDVVFTNHSSDGDFDIESNMQSIGTRRFAELTGSLYDMVSGNHVYFMDEIGIRLHSDLMTFYISVFLHNSNQSQLFFTTHNILLLDEDFIRRDIVYLVEKSADSATSSYTRVSDAGLHKNLSLYNAYKIGRLGAKPDLGSPYLDNVNEC